MSVDFLAAEVSQPVVVDFLEEIEVNSRRGISCVCNHPLMWHARKVAGIWTHKQGRCMIAGCVCTNAVDVV